LHQMGGEGYRGCPKDIADYINALSGKLKLKAVILFGSRARGEEDRFSDYDLLVVADDLPSDFRERLNLLWEEKPADIDVVGFTEEELLALIHRAMVLDALLDGKALLGDISAWRRLAEEHLAKENLIKTPFGYFHPIEEERA